ncbi:protein PXR1-like [Corylus avellana]|uniref:protein PXR1-like n=1 Tax=Corylus avellana TaxID=13451 RepID=UPI00286BA491|nr:protein PXR1-like [Corylus avellana]
MKNRKLKGKENGEKLNGSELIKMKNNKMKNMKRLGGRGLSLEAFINAKSKSDFYNPALIKKQKEFYKNAKNVKKYKKLLKQQSQQRDISLAISLDENETEDGSIMSMNNKNSKNRGIPSLKKMYEQKREKKESTRIEMEALNQAKKEEREKSEARRKSVREKMFKKTHAGQPVMKYRIEHLLETIENSAKN